MWALLLSLFFKPKNKRVLTFGRPIDQKLYSCPCLPEMPDDGAASGDDSNNINNNTNKYNIQSYHATDK